MLSVKQLHAGCDGKAIIKGLSLEVKPGEVHAIMGPNGSGKSTLSKVIAGDPSYEVTAGDIYFQGDSLRELPCDERARRGIFMSFQYPVEIPGVTNISFLKASVNAVRKAQGQQPLDAIDFLSTVRAACAQIQMDEAFLYRNLNEGFSGGEKKRNEILQMLLLQPQLMVLDETDSGLDIDALKWIAEGINAMRSPERAIILVTHYQRLLDYVAPDRVHVLCDGRIRQSGDKSLALKLEEEGYAWLTQEVA